jgi:hypothetical protein
MFRSIMKWPKLTKRWQRCIPDRSISHTSNKFIFRCHVMHGRIQTTTKCSWQYSTWECVLIKHVCLFNRCSLQRKACWWLGMSCSELSCLPIPDMNRAITRSYFSSNWQDTDGIDNLCNVIKNQKMNCWNIEKTLYLGGGNNLQRVHQW